MGWSRRVTRGVCHYLGQHLMLSSDRRVSRGLLSTRILKLPEEPCSAAIVGGRGECSLLRVVSLLILLCSRELERLLLERQEDVQLAPVVYLPELIDPYICIIYRCIIFNQPK